MSIIIHRNNAPRDKILASNVLMGTGNDNTDNVERRITDLENSEAHVAVDQILTEGVPIADIEVGNITTRLYAPEGGGTGTVTGVEVDGVSVVDENGVAEIPAIPSNLEDLADVNLSSPSDGQALVYDSTESKWVAGEAGQVDDVKVNGTSVVDVNKIAQITSYKELTQSQYDGLPNSKYTDGVLYCIKDDGIVEGDKYAPVIYSLAEREVGVWTDGKPMYAKTIHVTNLPSSTSTSGVNYPHNISNIDTICTYDAVARWSNGQATHLNHSVFTAGAQNSSITIVLSKTDINIVVGIDRSSMNADVTIYYTKTTDVPGSGSWGTDGVPMVHYSTDEKVIGTWIDGKTLYERTFTFSSALSIPSNTWTLTDIDSTNIEKIVYCMGLHSDGTCYAFIGADPTQSSHTKVGVWSARNTITSLYGMILQYTKTT
jgi:hypothetical protein